MDIYFYLTTDDLRIVEKAQNSLHTIWRSPALSWVWLTYLQMKNSGLDCKLTDSFPKQGIVVAASCTYPLFESTSKDICHISTVADSPPRFYPQIHVVQNQLQVQQYSSSFFVPQWCFIPHWPQPNLIPRDPARGELFENIGYVGHRSNLATELQSDDVQQKFREKGFKFHILDNCFNDYSCLDAILAVRSFDNQSYPHKPASKLVNAWRAGIPALLGPESAFQLLRKTSLDYIEVKTLNDCFQELEFLRENPQLRCEMVKNGFMRNQEFSEATITKLWLDLLQNQAPIIYQTWREQGAILRKGFHIDQYIRRMTRSFSKRYLGRTGSTISLKAPKLSTNLSS